MAFLDTNIIQRIPVPRYDGYEGFKSLTAAAIALTIITGGLLFLDPRMLGEELTWLKPFKFSVSFAMLFGTLALFTKHCHLKSGTAVCDRRCHCLQRRLPVRDGLHDGSGRARGAFAFQ